MAIKAMATKTIVARKSGDTGVSCSDRVNVDCFNGVAHVSGRIRNPILSGRCWWMWWGTRAAASEMMQGLAAPHVWTPRQRQAALPCDVESDLALDT
jgi:hypothetical protein